MSENGPVIRGLEETAAFFDVSVQTVKRWAADGCPVVKEGGNGVRYELDLRAVHDWRREQDEARAADAETRAEEETQLRLELVGADMLPDAEGGGQALTPKARRDALQAELSKVKLAELRRELVRADDVAMEMAQAFSLLSARMLAMPDHMGAELGLAEDQIETMRDLIEDVLNDAADAVRDLEPAQHDSAA